MEGAMVLRQKLVADAEVGLGMAVDGGVARGCFLMVVWVGGYNNNCINRDSLGEEESEHRESTMYMSTCLCIIQP